VGVAVAKLAEFQIDKVQEQGAGPQDCGADVEVDIGGTGAKVKGGMAMGVEGCINKEAGGSPEEQAAENPGGADSILWTGARVGSGVCHGMNFRMKGGVRPVTVVITIPCTSE
jgi:hypothetical protein